MAGNSSRRGAVRKSKKGALVGSGGQGRKALRGKGPTPRAEDRPGHPAARRAAAAQRSAGGGNPAWAKAAGGGQAAGGSKGGAGRAGRGNPGPGRASGDGPELLVGRNPVVEALRARVPATALYVAAGIETDERVSEALRVAGNRGIALLEISRAELDRMTGGLLHQGLALRVPPFGYTELTDLLAVARESATAPLLVALDGVTDPRNLGAVIRSATAFGAHGVLLPGRRAAGVTAVAWRASAGTAARMPVAQVTNLTRALRQCQDAGLLVAGLDADGSVSLDDLDVAPDPLVVVVGSEGRGLSRLVGDTCDLTVSIPMPGAAESLNASVAAAVTLAEIARRRRSAR
ncbi:MAG: 23S rRNA (guanosine(2251)-2'-O)-methyltransferase RlmB [Actinomycetia bacterium]|nr:23S rRNA (guanosine(2251)-2'-O)-methyltransferase RlmB [Actinomycetes bacterium]